MNYIKHPYLLCDSLVKHFGKWLPDETYIKLRYRFNMGKRLNLKNPITFQEKLQWLKLHDHNPLYTTLVDKIAVKGYVAKAIGSEYVIPLLGAWDRPENIDWDQLPNKFVLKTNHSGGNTGVVICRDKSTFDKEGAIKKLNASLKSDVYVSLREWQYKNVKKRVFAEEFVETRPALKDLPDYKWYCFNGEPKFCQVIQDRTTEETIDFFDTEWIHQEFVGLNAKVSNAKVSNAKVQPKCPKDLSIQIRIAKELSKDMPFSRIDLYQIEDKVYFGEITLYPASGIGVFDPERYDEILGKMIDLQRISANNGGGVIIRIANDNELSIEPIDLPDYKFFCFNGEVKALFVATGRQNPNEDVKFDYYDANYNHLPFRQEHENAKTPPRKPVSFEKMKQLAMTLSKGIPHVRIDFYEVNGHPIFGEFTFTHFAGMVPFEPEEWDYKFGKWIALPEIRVSKTKE